jgi:hypothetical protein
MLVKGEIEKNYTLDRFLLLKNSKEKIDILANNNKLEYKGERLSYESDFGSSDYSSSLKKKMKKMLLIMKILIFSQLKVYRWKYLILNNI